MLLLRHFVRSPLKRGITEKSDSHGLATVGDGLVIAPTKRVELGLFAARSFYKGTCITSFSGWVDILQPGKKQVVIYPNRWYLTLYLPKENAMVAMIGRYGGNYAAQYDSRIHKHNNAELVRNLNYGQVYLRATADINPEEEIIYADSFAAPSLD